MYCIQYGFIRCPSEFTVSEDAGIKPRTVATSALAVRRFKLHKICPKYLCAAHAVLEAGGKAETLPETFGEVPVQGKN
jgi:hypothetical protein